MTCKDCVHYEVCHALLSDFVLDYAGGNAE